MQDEKVADKDIGANIWWLLVCQVNDVYQNVARSNILPNESSHILILISSGKSREAAEEVEEIQVSRPQ